jgi:hypothetical protein
MDGGSNDGVCTIGTGRRRGREECLGWPESRGGEETVKKGGRVLDGLPVGAERRKEKMGVDSVARGKGGRGGPGVWQQRGSGGCLRQSVVWLTSRGIEGEATLIGGPEATVQGGGGKFISKIIKRIQIKFKSIQL